MKKLLVFLCAMSLVFSIVGVVEAIPPLGVSPGAPAEPGYASGTYFGPYPSDDDDLYQLVFANTFIGGEGGFALPPSGGDLSIWYGADDGGVNQGIDVYLLTTSLSGDDFIFGGVDFDLQSSFGDVASYKQDFYGINLGSINAPNENFIPVLTWNLLDKGEFGDGGKEFYVLTGIIEYSGFVPGEWMFAVADTNGNGIIGGKEFSPKTTSSTVHEPATMLLLGSGLIGLAVFGRKKLFKRG